jgi:hypothetical protein
MSKTRRKLADMSADEAASYVMNNDISDLLGEAELVRARRPAKMVTALRIDLATQSELEATALARGIRVTTLMRQIIEDWAANSLANRDARSLKLTSHRLRCCHDVRADHRQPGADGWSPLHSRAADPGCDRGRYGRRWYDR